MRFTSAIWLLIFSMLSATMFAQIPDDLSFNIAGKNGQTRFRMGESIPLDLNFTSAATGRYEAHNPESQTFTSQPADGVVNPLGEFPGVFGGSGRGGAVSAPRPLNSQPVTYNRELNNWLAFRKPGRYQITAEVKAVTLAGAGLAPKTASYIPTRSNALEIEIIDDPAWTRTQLQADIVVIEAHKPTTPGGRGSSTDFDDQNAAHALALLDTRESALAMVSIFSRNLDPEHLVSALSIGLRRSPFRAEAIAAMEKAIAAPDTPISDYFLGTLSDLAAVANSRPPDFAKSYAAVYNKLSQAIPLKRGEALTVSSATLARYTATLKNTPFR